MKFLIKVFLIIFSGSLISPILPIQAAGDAVMTLSSIKTDYNVGETVYVDIEVEPNGAYLNTVRSIMDFTGDDVLVIEDFNIGDAFPYLSPDFELNNETNDINVGGFILADSVNTDALFGTLIFKANSVGSSTINFLDGSHLIDVNQVDQINLAGCQGITINVIGEPLPAPTPSPVNQPPVFQQVGNKNINLGESVNFGVSASDPEGDPVNLTWEIPAGASFSNVLNNAAEVGGDFSWTPDKEGVYSATFTAVDPEDNIANLTVSISVSVEPLPPNHAPVFDPVSEKTVNAGEILTFNVTATDPDGDNVSLKLAELENAAFNIITSGPTSTGRFSWQPKTYGIYYALFEATDDHPENPLTKNLPVRITVFGGECPPCGGGDCPICQCEKETEELPVITEKEPPVISSPSHSNQDKWYAKNKPQFSWQVDDPGLGYHFNLDEKPFTDPDYAYFYSQENFFSFTEVADGFWYFHLKVKYADGWGPVSHYQVKIDTTPPEFFRPSIEQNQLYFSSLDKHSGVAYYEMKIGENPWQKVISPLNLDELPEYSSQLILRAVDKAGNAIESYIDLDKKEVVVEKEQKKYIVEEFAEIIEPPVIENVSFERLRDKLIVEDYLIVSGRAIPNSLVTVHLSTKPETVFYAQADKNGNWQAKLKKELAAKKYNLYATATIDDLISLPSEKVYFSLVEKFMPKEEVKLPFWLIGLIAILIILVIILLMKNISLRKKLGKFQSMLKKSKDKLWKK